LADITLTDIARSKDQVIDALGDGDAVRLSTEVERELGRTDTYYLCRYILGYDKLNSRFHKELARFHDRWLFHPQINLHPRGHYKTTILTVAGSIRLLLLDPNMTILILMNTQENARKVAKEIKRHFIDNPKFRALYPEHATSMRRQEGQSNAFTTPARTKSWIRSQSIEASSLSQRTTSNHYLHIKYDDIVDDKNTTTSELMADNYEAYTASLSLCDGQTSAGLPWHHLQGTRWHLADTYNQLLERQKISPAFKVLITSAYYERPNPVTGAEERTILFPEEFSWERLQFIKEQYDKQGSNLFSCTPGFATIWMADGTFKQIKDVKEGDEIVGVRQHKKYQVSHRTYLTRSKVLKVQSRVAMFLQKMTLENGDEIYCTPDHRWFTGRDDETHFMYKPAEPGSRLIKVVDPIQPDTSIDRIKAWQWLGGFLDGEGGLTGSIITATQSVKHNLPVVEKIRSVLDFLGIEYTEFPKQENDCICFNLKGGRAMKVRLLVNMDFAKSYQVQKQLFKNGKKICIDEPAVKKIELCGTNVPVYALVTETGNYISQGYVSKNCLYLNDPVPSEDACMDSGFLEWYDDGADEFKNKRLTHMILTDPSPAEKPNEGDPSVITAASMDSDGNYFVREIRRGWWRLHDLVKQIIQVWRAYRPYQVGVEWVASQKWLGQELDRVKRFEQAYFETLPMKRDPKRNKWQRQKQILFPLRAGRIHLPYRMRGEKDPAFLALRQEMRGYPKGRHDDILDTLSDMVEFLQPPPAIVKGPMQDFRNPPVVLGGGNHFQTGYSFRRKSYPNFHP